MEKIPLIFPEVKVNLEIKREWEKRSSPLSRRYKKNKKGSY